MDVKLDSQAEKRAAEASNLEPFGGINLLHVKRNLAELLRHIGQNGIFGTYTKHDISHVNAMLGIVDWIVPQATAERMSPADWLLIVLSVYFHDAGMLVTEDEFSSRDQSKFVQYKSEKLLTSDDAGQDYASKLKGMQGDELDRFLYQEFVRAHHAERIRSWLENPLRKGLGAAETVAKEIGRLLSPLTPPFLRDLGLVCESHHAENLDRVDLYPISQPYGNTAAESANVQYAAIILRTVDLLQVTRDRTPSIAYRFLNPSDPVSQQEWAKQMAVHAIVPQPARDEDGNVDHRAPKHTVEVHANFDNETGFFALTHYLSYAESQLNQSYKWADESVRRHGSTYDFPWRYIDQARIKTDGFLPEQFGFELDQARILDLLTGHTLYNNSTVVLRELTQNAIDAVRLQHNVIMDGDSRKSGLVTVEWDSKERILQVTDNGTGMTQDIVENNFLKVGSSRYQEKSFRETYPNFSPISRFGIGVLSAFMVADSVEVITVHQEEEKARRVSLRSVHGKYLIRLLDKDADAEALREIGPHGTRIRLRLRASSDFGDIVRLARDWFVLPECKLIVTVDNDAPHHVGYESLSAALKDELAAAAAKRNYFGEAVTIDVKEAEIGGVHLAYAVKWSPYYREWEFLHTFDASPLDRTARPPSLGICVEGVRVRSGTPGFTGNRIYALANVTGPGSPRTNVARSDLEETEEYKNLLRSVYGGYLSHVRDEVVSKQTDRQFSTTRAVAECRFLISSFARMESSDQIKLSSQGSFSQELRRIPTVVIESSGVRALASLEELFEYDVVRMVEDELIERTESLIRQLPMEMSLLSLVQSISALDVRLPSDPLIVAGLNTSLTVDVFMKEWEVAEIHVDVDTPRLDMAWRKRGETARWESTSNYFGTQTFQELINARALSDLDRIYPRRRDGISSTFLPIGDIKFQGTSTFAAVYTNYGTYLVPGPSWDSLVNLVCGYSDIGAATLEQRMFISFLCEMMLATAGRDVSKEAMGRYLDLHLPSILQASAIGRSLSLPSVEDCLLNCNWRSFDTKAWKRPGTFNTWG